MGIIRTLVAGGVVGTLQGATFKGIYETAKFVSTKVPTGHATKALFAVGVGLTTLFGAVEIYLGKQLFHGYWDTTAKALGEDSKIVEMTGTEYTKFAEHH